MPFYPPRFLRRPRGNSTNMPGRSEDVGLDESQDDIAQLAVAVRNPGFCNCTATCGYLGDKTMGICQGVQIDLLAVLCPVEIAHRNARSVSALLQRGHLAARQNYRHNQCTS